jgi:hypothetical protein
MCNSCSLLDSIVGRLAWSKLGSPMKRLLVVPGNTGSSRQVRGRSEIIWLIMTQWKEVA